MTLPELLIRYRERANLTVAEAARRMNWSRQAVWRWETDRRTPDHDTLRKLLDIYGVSIHEWEEAERLRRAMVAP